MDGTYELGLVATSLVIASLSSYTALSLAGRISAAARPAAHWWLIGGALAMGTGVWSMHFIGMLSFRLPLALSYDILTTAVSWLIAVVASGYALYCIDAPTLQWRRLVLSGSLMGAGIASMHYLGMAALSLSPAIEYRWMPLLASIAIAVLASMAALWLAFQLRRQQSPYALARQIGAALVMGGAIAGMHYTGMAAANFAADSVCLTRGGLSEEGLSTLVTVVSVCALTLALALAHFDVRLQRDTGRLTASLNHAQSELEFLVTHDALTRLPNRLLLRDRIEHAIAHSARNGTRSAVLFFDIDRFKSVNDSFGHATGDELLRQVAVRAQAMLRTEDTVARIGGDEFAAVLPGIAQGAPAGALAARMLADLARPYHHNGASFYVSASIGIALYPDDAENAESLLAAADAAMYHAKRSGRNNYQFFSPEMNAFDRARVELENGLRAALAEKQFELHYQPKVDVASGAIVSMEALLRWRHPQRGLVSPTEFIPIAEETGLIIRIGEWVLNEACMQSHKWQQEGLPPMRVAVNLSAHQFRDPQLLPTIAEALAQADLAPCYLEVELTESIVMRDVEQAATILRSLSDLGVHLSIDDFGTGYSSLAYLKRFPLDTLKIDRMFVRDLANGPEDLAIVRAIISLAHSLRLKVIAEGVETEAQLEALRALQCDEYQGYLYAPALEPAALAAMLREGALVDSMKPNSTAGESQHGDITS